MNIHGKNQRNTLRAYPYAQKAGQNQGKEKPMNLKKNINPLFVSLPPSAC